MEGKASIVFFIFFSLIIIASAAFALDVAETDYRQTVFKFKDPDQSYLINKIRKEATRNDHTANVFLNQRQKTFFLIHHKSLSMRALEKILTDSGISVIAVTQYNYQAQKKLLVPRNHINSLGSYRNCGATKTAWKSLLRKYFHE